MSVDYKEMPYGMFIQRSFVWIFNRRYQPIAMTRWLGYTVTSPDGGGRLHIADLVPVAPAVWVEDIVGQIYFYDDHTAPSRDRRTRAELERLLEAYPVLAAEITRRQGVRT
jgi:hypothetical protein